MRVFMKSAIAKWLIFGGLLVGGVGGISAILLTARASNDPSDGTFLAAYPSDAWPSWSPDGQKIAFQSDRNPSQSGGLPISSIFTVSSTGGASLQLLNYYDLSSAAWSSDGSQIVFLADSQIYVRNQANGILHKLTQGDRDGIDPAWTADSTHIVFSAERSGFDSDIFTTARNANPNVAGTQQRLVRLDGLDRFPVCSPDGTKIAFVHQATDSDGSTADIVIAAADGSNPTIIYHCPTDISRLSWFPDNDHLLVQQDSYDAAADSFIKIVSVSSGTATPLQVPDSHLINSGTDAVISPDGTKIAFAAPSSDGNSSFIYQCNLDGSNLVQVTSSSTSLLAKANGPTAKVAKATDKKSRVTAGSVKKVAQAKRNHANLPPQQISAERKTNSKGVVKPPQTMAKLLPML